jgi:hypothetical protein
MDLPMGLAIAVKLSLDTDLRTFTAEDASAPYGIGDKEEDGCCSAFEGVDEEGEEDWCVADNEGAADDSN